MSCTSCKSSTIGRGSNISWDNFAANPQQFACSSEGSTCTFTTDGSINYVIIGDTAAASLYAARLVCNGVPNANINVLSQGAGTFIADPEATDINFSHIRDNDLVVTQSVKINAVPYPGNDTPNFSGLDQRVVSYIQSYQTGTVGIAGQLSTVTYYYGAGPFGDMLATYIVPRMGPWFINSDQRLQTRFYTTTQTFTLSDIEMFLYADIRTKFCLQSTCLNYVLSNKNSVKTGSNVCSGTRAIASIMLNPPDVVGSTCRYSQLSQGYQTIFVTPGDESTESDWCPPSNTQYNKQIYRDILFQPVLRVGQTDGVQYYTGVNNLIMTGTASNYSVTFNSNEAINGDNAITINNAKIIWMTNPYQYLLYVNGANNVNTGLANSLGFATGNINIPITFRTVLRIPKNNAAGVDLTNAVDKVGDGVTSYLSFSLRPQGYSNCSGTSNTFTASMGILPQWFVQAYTTDVDYYPLSPTPANSQTAANFANNPAGTGATGSYTNLIIEVVTTQTYRRANSTGNPTNPIDVAYARPDYEATVFQQFLIIAANIYNAYTGVNFTDVAAVVDFFLGGKPTESNNEIPVTYSPSTKTFMTREMTITTLLQMGSALYGNDSYPCAWARGGSNTLRTCPIGGCQ